MSRVSNRGSAQAFEGVPARRDARVSGRRPVPVLGIILWVLGVVILAVAAVIVHGHIAPWPLELNLTKNVQGPHPIPCPVPDQPHSWFQAGLFDVSMLNNPMPSVIAGAVWLVLLLISRLFRQALYFIVAVASAGGLFLLLTPLVARPRPSLHYGICVHDTYPYYSFPSGHVIHDVVSSGFLLFITFSEPVRSWRYRWLLLPLQLFFLLDILLIGYSRVLEGDHWLFDALGGYLVGFLWLAFFIFLYNRTAHLFTRENLRKLFRGRRGQVA